MSAQQEQLREGDPRLRDRARESGEAGGVSDDPVWVEAQKLTRLYVSYIVLGRPVMGRER